MPSLLVPRRGGPRAGGWPAFSFLAVAALALAAGLMLGMSLQRGPQAYASWAGTEYADGYAAHQRLNTALSTCLSPATATPVPTATATP